MVNPNDLQSPWIGRTRDDWDDYWNTDEGEYDDDCDEEES